MAIREAAHMGCLETTFATVLVPGASNFILQRNKACESRIDTRDQIAHRGSGLWRSRSSARSTSFIPAVLDPCFGLLCILLVSFCHSFGVLASCVPSSRIATVHNERNFVLRLSRLRSNSREIQSSLGILPLLPDQPRRLRWDQLRVDPL